MLKRIVKEVNYYGLDHEAVNKKFSGDLTYIRTFTIGAHYWAVYRAKSPDKSKGHKRYMMLGHRPNSDQWYVSGRTSKEIQKDRKQDAVLCMMCKTILYSIHVHHYHGCGCTNQTFVDGGREYLRCGGVDAGKVRSGTLDLLTGKFRLSRVKKKK